MNKPSRMPLAKLVEDFTLYPRHAVDDKHVAHLTNVIKAGTLLPPIVVEAGTGRIVDGWHRARAFTRVLGSTGVVEVVQKSYTSENDLLLDAMAYNATHGRKLDVQDQTRVIILCAERGIAMVTVAAVLHLPEERIQKLRVKVATAPSAGPSTITGTLRVAVRGATAHLAGQTLTTAQAEAARSAPGVSYALLADQLRQGVESGLINRADERLMQSLRLLRDALVKGLAD